MSPRIEQEAAMDDMADYAAKFAPICTAPPAHPAPRFVTPHEASGIARREPSVLALSTPALTFNAIDRRHA